MRRLITAAAMSICLSYVTLALAVDGQGSFVLPEHAANPGPATPAADRFDLAKCIEYALRNNNRSKVSRDGVEAAVALHKQALSSWWPQVSGKVLASRMDQDVNFIFPSSIISLPASSLTLPPTTVTLPANAFGPGFPPADVPLTVPPMSLSVPAQNIAIPSQNIKMMDRDNLLGSLNVTFPIYTGGLRGSRIQQARQGVEVARQDERRTDLEVIYDVQRLYYAGVLAQRTVQIAKDTLARMEATLDLTEQLYKTGTGTVKKTDYLRNKSMVETIRSVLAELESKEQIVQATLVAVMGMDWTGRVEIVDREIPFAPFDCDVQALVDKAYRSNPDMAKVEAAVKAAEMGVRAARSGHLPKIALLGSAVGIANSYSAGIVTPENKRSWMVGIGIDIPIFEGFRVTAEERQARASLQKLQHQLALLRQSLALQVQTACSDLLKTRRQEKSSREALQSAAENRELNVRAYQEELVETKDVIEAQLMEALLSGQHQKVLYDHIEALAKLDLVVGSNVTNLPSSRK